MIRHIPPSASNGFPYLTSSSPVSSLQYAKFAFLFALVASASAFAPASKPVAFRTALNMEYGKYDDKMWDMPAKQEVYAAWDPTSPRSPNNFNPFETFEGNSPDASGFYPGEGRYKDPQRPDVSYSIMLEERKILDDVAANPKAAKGCPGCRN